MSEASRVLHQEVMRVASLLEQVSARLTDTRYDEKLALIQDLATKNSDATHRLYKLVTETLVAEMEKLEEGQNSTRVAIMDRIDRMQGTIEMLREDMRVNWGTADFAINNSKNVRAEVDLLLTLISQLERRHQTLAAQVEELRNRDMPKGAG